MQRHELLAALGELRLRGMVAAFDEAVVQGIRQRHTVEEILGELLRAEAAERQSRSIRYRLGIAGLPEMKDLEGFRFDFSPVNEALVRSLHEGAFLAQRRNAVLVGGTGTGKTHLSIAITANVIRAGTRARFFNVVDLVNRLEAESRNRKAGMLANHLRRLALVVAQPKGQPVASHPGDPAPDAVAVPLHAADSPGSAPPEDRQRAAPERRLDIRTDELARGVRALVMVR